MERVVVVGGGVLGTLHAVAARRRGLEVLHLEREPEPRGASVRNFGLIWVSGRAAGPELSLALRARAGWEELAAEVPGAGFRPNGSLTLAADEAELAAAEAGGRAARRGDPRATSCSTPARPGRSTRRCAASSPGPCAAAGTRSSSRAWRCRRSASTCWPGAARPAGYRWLPGREVVEVAPHAVRDHTGEWHRGDLVVLCTGATHTGLAGRTWLATRSRRCAGSGCR